MKSIKTIEDISNFLFNIPSGHMSIFFGAGVSFNSGLPLANELKKEILNQFNMSNYWNMLMDIPFENFMEFLCGFADKNLALLNIFNLGEPCLFHLLIAHLIRYERIQNIMTTNFDLLLEKACQKNRTALQRLYTEQQFKKVKIEAPCYIKIHGSIENIKSSRIFLKDISKIENIQCRDKILKYFFSDSNEEYIIVFGYSCSDVFDITPFLNTLTRPKKRVIFIEHHNKCKKIKISRNKGCFKNFRGFTIQCDTNQLIEKWATKEFFQQQKTSIMQPLWKDDCRMISHSIQHRAKFVIAALLQHCTLWRESTILFSEFLDEHEESLTDTEKVKIYSALSFNLYNLIISKAIDPKSICKYKYIQKADKILKENPTIDAYIYKTTYLKYAKLLTLDNRINEALLVYEAIDNIPLNKDNPDFAFQQASLQNNIGELHFSLYKQTKNRKYLKIAQQNYQDAFHFFQDIGGYVLEKGISFLHFAEILLVDKKPDFKQISKHISNAIKIAQIIGYQDGLKKSKQLKHELYKKKFFSYLQLHFGKTRK